MCSSHLGLWVLSDGAFDTPLARYEQLYTDYLRAFIDSAIEYGPDASSASMRTLLPYLKQQLTQHRRTILKMEDTPIELRAPRRTLHAAGRSPPPQADVD